MSRPFRCKLYIIRPVALFNMVNSVGLTSEFRDSNQTYDYLNQKFAALRSFGALGLMML